MSNPKMVNQKALTHFVAVSDLSKPPEEQEGILLEVEGRGADSEKNRAKALSIAYQMWERGEINADNFPDGITNEHIFYVPPDSQRLQPPQSSFSEEKLLPIVQGAQEIIQLTKLQIEAQEAAAEVVPYKAIIEAVLDQSRPLSAEEKDLAKDKKYGKVIERMGTAIALQQEYQQTCTGNGKLLLNAIAWQVNQLSQATPEVRTTSSGGTQTIESEEK